MLKLLIKNTTGENIKNITVEITSEPDFALTWKHTVDHLVKDASIEVTPINLRISSKYLSELAERVAGIFKITLPTGEKVIYEQEFDVSILAFDQWKM